MSDPSNSTRPTSVRFGKVKVSELPRDIIDLAAAVGKLPEETRKKLEPSFARVIDSTKRRRRILSLVQDALSQLRLDMKYLVFDLEATRRERDEFRRQLDGPE